MEAGTGARPAQASWVFAARELLADYIALTKPRVISLLLVTTAATMFVADASPPIGLVLATLVGGYLAAGGAGAINHYVERDIDARMSRTSRRPLPSGPARRSGSASCSERCPSCCSPWR
jgi:protoheme IX farnesyltransferase